MKKIILRNPVLIYTLSFLYLLFRGKRKLNIGAGLFTIREGWVCSDITVLNILKPSDWKKMLLFLKVDNIFAEHVWEHITPEDAIPANKNCFRFLKKGGVLRLAVPDGYHPDPAYIEYVRPGGHGAGADDHKLLYTYKIMTDYLEQAGFTVNLLEYWDENGKFHYTDWTNEAGLVTRSRRYDDRNANGELKYTSLIVDAVKK